MVSCFMYSYSLPNNGFINIYISSARSLTSLENTLLQFFALLFGLVGSYFIGKNSAKDAAYEIIKPHAKSVFRRLISFK